VGHVEESKGWTFWIPVTKKLVSSAWADFGRNSLPSGLGAADIKALELGNFKEEESVEEQEHNVDQLADKTTPVQKDVPTTFRNGG
jgi:hypothetical protein